MVRILPTMSSELSCLVTFNCFLCHYFVCVCCALPSQRPNQSINQSICSLASHTLAVIRGCGLRDYNIIVSLFKTALVALSVEALQSNRGTRSTGIGTIPRRFLTRGFR